MMRWLVTLGLVAVLQTSSSAQPCGPCGPCPPSGPGGQLPHHGDGRSRPDHDSGAASSPAACPVTMFRLLRPVPGGRLPA